MRVHTLKNFMVMVILTFASPFQCSIGGNGLKKNYCHPFNPNIQLLTVTTIISNHSSQ